MTRQAVVTDVGPIATIEVECFGRAARSEASIRDEIDSARRTVLVHCSDGVLAYGVISVLDDVADLERIAVLPPARRKGLARFMLADLIDRAAGRGATRMLLEVSAANAGAIALYGSSGFAIISRRARYYPDGSDALVMERALEGGS